MLAKLNYFYKHICAKQVSKVMMHKLEKEIMMLVYKMERVFPTRWFNMMEKIGLEDMCSSDECIVKKGK
jgi:hypothetical protein